MAFDIPNLTFNDTSVINKLKGLNEAQKQSLENKYYSPNIKSEIGYRNALTQGKNIENQYEPEKLKLANIFQSLQNQYYAPNIQSEISNRNSLTNKNNIMTPLEAEELKIKNKLLPQTLQSDINYKNMGGVRGGGVDQQQLNALKNQISLENPNWDPIKVNQAASAYLSANDTLPDGTKLPSASGIVDTILSSIVKHTNTAQGENQQRFALTTDNLLKEGEKYIPSISKYSGLLGKSIGGLDSVQNSLGYNTPDYENYIFFTRHFVPAAAGEMMRAFGVNASDTQKKLYQSVINPLSWDQNPKGAMENYKRMQQMFNTVSKTIGKSPNKIRSELNKGSNGKATLRYNQSTGDFEEIK